MNNLIDSHHKDYIKDLNPEDIKIKDFRKLKAFQLSLDFYKECLIMINRLPKSEEYILKKQLRGSCQSTIAQIAEGNSQLYTKVECRFISIALGSVCESQAHLDIALVSNYITKEEHKKLDDIANEIKSLLICYLREFLKQNKNNNNKENGGI